MIPGVQEIASALARAWVRLYTRRMPPDLRELRRAEIDADLWEQQRDAREGGVPQATVAVETLLRTVIGIPDDVGWCFEATSARRAAAIEGRIGTMAISVRQTRWMGLCGLLGGALWAGSSFVEVPLGNFGYLILWPLFSLGMVGLYVQQHGRAGKAGLAGLILLLAGFASMLTVGVAGMFFGLSGEALLMNILAAGAMVVMLPIGFLLMGIGMPSPSRRVPLIVGLCLCAWILIGVAGRVLSDYYPFAATWFRGDSPVAGAAFFLMGIGLVAIGYSVFRNAAPAPETGS